MNRIRKMISLFEWQKAEIDKEIKAVQENCPHKTSVYSAHGSTDNWDRDDSYWFMFYCYDCGKRWSTDQSVRPKGPMKVDKIDYDEQPEVIELKMRIEEIKR